MSTLRRLDRIDVAYDIRDGDIRRRKLFDEPVISLHPVDLRRVPMQLNLLPAIRAQRRKRVIIYFRTGDDGNLFVKKVGQLANDPRLRLPSKTEKYEIMSRKNRVDDLRNDRFVVSKDTRKQTLAGSQLCY